MRLPDKNNVVPQQLAEKYGFEPEYSLRDGLELWGKRLEKGEYNYLLKLLLISNFTTEDKFKGYVRITVKPDKKGFNKNKFNKPFTGSDGEYTGNKPLTLNESQLRNIIKESVKRVLKEAKHLQGAKELNDLGGIKATGKGKGKHLSAKTFNGDEFEKNADEWCGKHGCKRYTGKEK